MPGDTTGSASQSAFAEYCVNMFDRFAEGRKDLEEKWNRNLTDFRGEYRNMFWKKNDGKDWRSRTTSGIPRQKTMTAFALILDLAIEDGRIQFDIVPSKRMISEDVNAAKTYVDIIKEADDLITEQFDRCHADRSMKSNIISMLSMGVTYAKFTRRTWTDDGWQPVSAPGIDDMSSLPAESLQYEPYSHSDTGPAWEWTSNWEMFTDPEYGGDPRSGDGVMQSRLISPRHLRKKIGRPFYIESEILAVIEATEKGSGEADAQDDSSIQPSQRVQYTSSTYGSQSNQRSIPNPTRTIRSTEQWIYAPRKKVEEWEASLATSIEGGFVAPTAGIGEDDKDGDDVFCLVELANDRIVRYVQVQPKENPFFSAVCEQHPDERMPRGVVDNAQPAHEGATKALRAIEDNVNWANNPVFARIRGFFKGMPKEIEPGATYDIDESRVTDARQALYQVPMTPMINELVALLGINEKYADWDTFFSKIDQGQVQEKKVTATATLEQAERSDKYSATIMRNLDDGLTEPMGTRFFTNNMNDPNVTTGQGDFRFRAQGWEAQQTRIGRVNALRTFLEVVMLDPDFKKEVKLRGFLEPLADAAAIDKGTILKTDAEKQADAEAELQSEDRALALEGAQADVRKTHAEAARAEADAAATTAGIEQADEEIDLKRVDTISKATEAAKQETPNEENQ